MYPRILRKLVADPQSTIWEPLHQRYTVTIRSQALHVYRGQTISIIYSECVYVALSFEHAKRMRCTIICGRSDCTVLFHIIS